MIRKVFDYSLIIFVVLGTLFYRQSPPNLNSHQMMEFGYMIQELFFRYGVIFLFALTMMMRPARNLSAAALPAFLLFALTLGVFIGFDLSVRRAVLNLFCGAVFYKIVAEYINLEWLKKYAVWFWGLVAANLALCTLQWFNLDLIYRHVNYDIVPRSETVVGFMKLQANLGVLAALLSPFLWFLSSWLCLFAIPLLVFGKSSVAILAFLVSFFFNLWFNVKRWVFAVVVVTLLSAGAFFVVKYDMPSGQFGERFKIWHFSTGMALKESPFVGYGLGGFAKFAPAQKQSVPENKVWVWLHNDLLQVFFETGIIGLSILLVFLRERFREFKRYFRIQEVRILFSCLLSIFIISLAHFPFHVGKFAGLCVFLMAVFQAVITEAQNEKKNPHLVVGLS